MKRILNKNSITIIIFLAILTGGIFFNFIFNDQTGSKTNDKQIEKQKITFGTYPVSTNLPLFIAKEKGLFENNGLNIELKPFQDGGQVNNAIFTGKVDGGDVAIPIFLAAQATSDQQKIHIISVQIEEKDNPIYELLVPKNIASYIELNSKKIGFYPPTPSTKIALESLLAYKGITNTTNIQFSPTTLVPAFQAGKVNAIFTIAPLTTLTKKNNLGINLDQNKGIVAESMNIKPLPAAAYILSNNYIEIHPDAAKKVILSLDQAVDFIRTNPDESRKILTKYLPEQQKTLVPYLPIVSNWKSTEIQADKIKAYQQLLIDKKILKKTVNIDSLIIKQFSLK